MKITAVNSYLKTVNLSFKRKMEEHQSWGANVDSDTKDVSFKIFTFPDVKSVDVKIYDKNNPEKYTLYPLKNKGEGIFETENGLSSSKAAIGDKYSYVIKKNEGTVKEVKDPYAKRQGNGTEEDFIKYSIIYDHSDFQWKNQEKWLMNPERIIKNPKDGQIGIQDAVIYEMQIDTLTQEGTYEAAKQKLQGIKDAGFNTIQMMPNENCFSPNWGYDGEDKMAPPEHRGGPDKLKELIDEAHKLGLNVIMDYVPNHLGPDGAQLEKTGPYIKGDNIFGKALNFEGENSKYVRDYIVNAAINWLQNYKVDGLRLDMTKFMESDFTMKEIAAEINHHFPNAVLIAEDSRQGISISDTGYFEDYRELHDKRVVNPLKSDEICKGDIEKHCKYIDSIDKYIEKHNKEGLDSHSILINLGYDSEWDFAFHHSLNDNIFAFNTNPSDNPRLYDLVEAIYQSQKNVKYVTSHDETGNYDGTRPVIKYLVPKLNMNSYIVLNDEDRKRIQDYAKLKHTSLDEAGKAVTIQKAQHAAEALVKLLSEGKLDSYKYKKQDEFYEDILKELEISPYSDITYKKLLRDYKKSMAQFRMAQALTFAIPGPKMVFQGDENLDITPFRFFREYLSVPYEDYLETEKGYKPGIPALLASKLDSIKYSDNAKTLMEQHNNLTKDLNILNRENPALTKGNLVLRKDGSKDCFIHQNAIGLHTKDEKSGNEFFVVTNFGDENYPDTFNEKYYMPFPEGRWVEVLNTNSKKYGGDGKYLNKNEAFAGMGLDDNNSIKIPVNIGKFSTVYFKRAG